MRLLVIEDHPIVRDGCRRICSRPGVEVVEAATAEEGLAADRDLQPEIIILDLNLGRKNGLDIIEELLSDNPTAGIIVFSVYEGAHFISRALELGARAYITKNDDPTVILKAIDKINAGAIFLGPTAAHTLAMASLESGETLTELTEREKRVMNFLGDGKDLSEVAALSGIGYKTAANCVASLKRKLGFQTTAALIKYAVERTGKIA